jgi:hypothetical protein
MLSHSSNLWVPYGSKRAVLQCGSILALLMLATLAIHIAVPRAGQTNPGACQRQAGWLLPSGPLH